MLNLSCFENRLCESEERHEFSLDGLMTLIEGRKTEKKEGSYTTYLFEKGMANVKACSEALKQAEIKITNLSEVE